jgi:hypothetical protein
MKICVDWEKSQQENKELRAVFGDDVKSKIKFEPKKGSVVVRIESAYSPDMAKKNKMGDNFSRRWLQTPLLTLLANVTWPSKYLSIHEVILAGPCKVFVDLDGFTGSYLTMIDLFESSFTPFMRDTLKLDLRTNNYQWLESTRYDAGNVTKNSLHMTLSGYAFHSVLQVKELMTQFRATLAADHPLLIDGVLDMQPYGFHKSLRVDGSAKLEEPGRAVRQVRGRHSGKPCDSYVTFVQDTDLVLDDMVETVDDADVMLMLQKIMDSYAKEVGSKPSTIAGAKQHPTFPWRYTVRLPECKFCFRKEGYHTNSTVFYKIDLLTNKVFQSCFSPHCKGKEEAVHEHTEGYMGDLFVSIHRINLARVVELGKKLIARFAQKSAVDIANELRAMKTDGQAARYLALELDRRKIHPQFVGFFMDAIMPYLNRYWGKTSYTTEPFVITPYVFRTLDFKDEFCTENMQRPERFVVSSGQFKLPVGGKDVPITKLWLEHPLCKTYDSFQFVPKRTDVQRGIYNMFHGFSVQVADAKQMSFPPNVVQPFLDHIYNVWCRTDHKLCQYVLSWFAHVYQKPWKKTQVALVLRGSKGSGKGVVMEFMKQIFGGQTYWHINKLDDVTGNFTAPKRATCVLGFADECFFGGDPSQTSSLKTTITEDNVTVNVKNIPQFEIRNVINLVVATNDKRSVPAGVGPRRLQCLETSEKYAGAETVQSEQYYKRLRAVPIQAVANFLAQRDITHFSTFSLVKTEELVRQQLHSMPPLNRWWADVLEEGETWGGGVVWPDQQDVPFLEADYDRWLARNQVKYGLDSRRIFMKDFGAMIGKGYDGKDLADPKLQADVPWNESVVPQVITRATVAGVRVSIFKLPPLNDCKARFNRFVGTPMFEVH